MRTITPNQFRELADFSAGLCVSLYLPTQPVAQESLDHSDRLRLKNQMKEVARQIAGKGFSERHVQELLDPLQRLTDDSRFWRQPSKSLAVFLAADYLQYFYLPIAVEPLTYVAYEFYLKPLLPVLSGYQTYFLLSLNLQQVELFRGDRYNFEKVNTEVPIPQNIEEVVGSDFKPKFHSVYGGKVGGHPHFGYYGQGEWKEDEKQEILQFFREVHDAIDPVLKSTNIPLLLAGLDHLIALYRQVGNTPQLMEEALRLNPKDKNREELHGQSWQIMTPFFDREKLKLKERIQQFRDTERASTEIQEVIPAALGGRIEALFLDKATEIWGVYYPKNAKTTVQAEQQTDNTSLTNLAAVQVYLKGGSVFLIDQAEMPLDYAPVNALFRF